MKLVTVKQLSPTQRSEVQQLSPSYPIEEYEQHYFLYSDEGELYSIFSAILLPDGSLETTAFTRTDKRQHGCFTMLLETCLQEYPETDLIFPVNHQSADALRTMTALEAECLSTEYRMERRLQAEVSLPSTPLSLSLTLLAVDEQTRVLFHNDHTPVGYCKVTASGDGYCLHEVEINGNVRGQGYGTAMITLLLENLAASGAKSVFLHVSHANVPACSLYKKTGFQITETLSYFLY